MPLMCNKFVIQKIASAFTVRSMLRKLGLWLVALAMIAVGLCVTGFGQKYYRLGGAWVGGNPAYTWSCLFAPTDALGQTAAARPILSYFNTQFAGLLASFGADNLSDGNG